MTLLIGDKRNELETLCRHFHVRRLALFGSALTPDFDPQRSDLDFVVDFEPLPQGQYARTYFAFMEALAKLFGRPVDLLESNAIRNPYIRMEVEKTQETLYAA